MTKSFSKSNEGKEIRVSKRGSASQAIGKLTKNQDVFILTYGQFSLIDALMAIIDQTGPAHVTISTWTAAHAHLDMSAELMASADILSLRMIVDRSFKTRQPKYFKRMIDLFGADCIREIRTHAKFVTIRNDEWNIVCRTSMNLNENPRLENIVVSDGLEFADFFEQIADDIFKEVPPHFSQSELLELAGIPESTTFKEVNAGYIKRGNLNEPKYTHQLEKHGVCTRTVFGKS